jgi:UDPglucose 6-dehydrogenase
MYQFAQSHNMDYDAIRSIACIDKRIGLSHSAVPGHDGKKGFGGTCFPKDMASLEYQMKQQNVSSSVVSAAIARNTHVDRPEKDWL